MSGNPNYDMKVGIDDVVMPLIEDQSILRFLGPNVRKIGAGQQVWKRSIAEPLRIPAAQMEIEKLVPQAFITTEGKYRLPRLNLSARMTEDEYDARLEGGDLPAQIEGLGNTMALAVDKLAFQGKTLATNEVQCHALNDQPVGDGTKSRPLTAKDGTKKGSWATATYAIGDFGTLKGGLDVFKAFDGPRLLLAPSPAMTTFNGVCPGLTTGQLIIDKARDMFSAVHTVPDDDPAAPGATATNLLTGEVELESDFELFCINPLCFTWVYDKPPFSNLVHDIPNKRWIYELEVHGALVPTTLAYMAGKTYRACTKVDACNT